VTERVGSAYDLFISYANADRAWVEGYLLDGLIQAGVRCHTEAAFALGVPRLLEFERAVQESQRTLLVLSPAYLAEGFTQFTDLLAQSYGLESATWPVIPLILQPVEMPPRLALLTVLDATDPADWPQVIARLCAELQQAVPGPAPRPPCPYPGMVPFSEEDSERFFGREREAQELLERLRLHPFLAVIGPSGSGKSSLVFAGLLPALRKSSLFGPGKWLVRTVRPGKAPLAALAAALGGEPANVAETVPALLATEPDARRLLLVVDQFEELFTLARADVEPFQRALLRLAETPKSTDQETDKRITNCRVVLTVRADFYPDLMVAPLWPEIQAHRAEVLPLDEDGLRQAIVRPAEDAGVFVESALVERLVADAAGEPGVLPLVQEALVLLWERLERRFLPLSAYEALGGAGRTGLQAAMARRADAVLADLAPQQRAIARRTFLRLVQFGEGRADTRRQQSVVDLRAAGDAPGTFEHALERLAHNRLLTLSGEERAAGRQVDIAHEALITGWPTLQTWLSQRREAEQTRRRLEAKATEWERLGQGSGGLLDQVELAEAERWLGSPDAADLGRSETLTVLVQASQEAIEAARWEKEATRRRELEQAQALAAAERQRAEEQALFSRRLRTRLMIAVTLALIAFVAAVGAGYGFKRAVAERKRAEQQARLALAGQLAAQSQAALDSYPQRSLLLAVEALSVTMRAGEPRVPAAEQTLREALAHAGGCGLGGHEGAILAVAISPDGHWLVTGSTDGTARLWDLSASDPAAAPVVLRGHEDGVWAVTISPNGHWLVTGSRDGTARLWDLSAPDPAATPVVLRGHEGAISAVAISPDGHRLVTGSYDGTARLWDLSTPDPAAAPVVLRGHEGDVLAIAISPDGHWLVTGSGDGTARLWDLSASDPATAPVVLRGHENWIAAVAISPDGHWLATGSGDGTARLWDLTASDPAATPVVLDGHENAIGAVAISRDGHWLVTGSGDGTARLWDLSASDPAAAPVVLRGHEGPFLAIAISPDGHWLVTGSQDRTARLWDLRASDPAAAPVVLRGHESGIEVVAISPDGHWLVTGSWDNTARLWDLSASDPAAAPVVLRGHEWGITAIAISPDGHWLVTGSGDDTARLWDLRASGPVAAPILLRGHEGGVTAVAISPDGHWLATGSGDGTARLWDLSASDPTAAPIVLRGHEGPISAVAISPDGHRLVTGSWDGTARLWDLSASDPAAAPVVLSGHEDDVWAVAISPNGHWLVTGSRDDTARLWDLSASDPATAPVVLRGHENWITAVAISPDGHWLATGSGDGTARLWDLTASDPAATPVVLRGHEWGITAIAISPDGHWLATGSGDGTARLWDLRAPGPVAAPIVLRGHEWGITAIAISPDGHWLATGSQDGTACLWDLSASDPAAAPVVLRGHEGPIGAIAISPDGHWLVTGSGDGTARLWNLRLGELMDLACRTAGRNLTRAEWEQYFPGQEYRRTCERPLEEE